MSQQAPYIHKKSPILSIECEQAFKELTDQEKLYSYYFSRASWEGAKLCYFQRSYESPALFYILYKIFSLENPKIVQENLTKQNYTQDEIDSIFVYCSAFFQNCGNYKSFGDTKFIPQVSEQKFENFIKTSAAYQQDSQKIQQIWDQIKLEIFSFQHPYYFIEMSDNQGHTSYYSSNVKKEEAEKVTNFVESKGISVLNTRMIKRSEKEFEILVASAHQSETKVFQDSNGNNIKIIYGDFSPIMKNLYNYLAQALPYSANDNQKQMIIEYLYHFHSGSIEKHKQASINWINDKGPAVETYIGFIEMYLDPIKVRAEFEGLVSIVNKKESQRLNNLVSEAEKLIEKLPWPPEFEIETFSKPDFTSLEVLTFACSGTPVGINIPNYDDIRQNVGFKNVNLGNVYGNPNKDTVLFTKPENIDNFIKYYKPSLFVIVALHELLGHGTGKLFSIDADGKYNFDYEMVHPLTGQEITTYYDVNETWNGKFGEISSGYEECRADGVALYLSCFQESLDILIPEYSKEEQSDIVYAAWYEIVYSAIKGLEYYDVSQKKWGQAHIRAAYVLLQAMLQEGDDFLKIEESELNGKPYLYINLNKEKIWTVGKKAVGNLLTGLQVYKSTADVQAGTQFFEQYSQVDDTMLRYRDIAIANKLPRKIELQHDVKLVGADQSAEYVQFEKSLSGIIESHIYHYKTSDIETIFTEWDKYKSDFRIKQ